MIKLCQPYIPAEAIEKCVEVLKSGNLVQGKYVAEFEEALNNYLGAKHTIVVSSGTAALHLSLIAFGIGPGDEVIVPAFSFPATANVVEILGATPVFVDITLDDFCIDVSLIESAITTKTKAIMPVHEFGQPADMKQILEIANRFKLFVIEDAACALGAEHEGNKVGTIGDIGCFSFHPRKTITTGEGGAITTNDDNIAKKILAIRNHGIVREGGKSDFFYAGFNYRMTDFQAVLGISQIPILDYLISKRTEQADEYFKKLSGIDWIIAPKTFNTRRMIFQSYHILINTKISSIELKENLFNNGIEVNIGAYFIPELTFFRNKYKLMLNDFPNAKKADNGGLVLPLGTHIDGSTIDFIFTKIHEYGSKYS